ncbi:MAG: secretion system protein E, partial [Chloroflexi bacterium]|nr:secretion system protein E [Chloroflexota bacterium]
MTHIAYPFQPKIVEEEASKDPFSSPFFKSLPPDLQEASREHPHLLEYLNLLPVGDIGIPQYMAKLTRDAGKLESKNLIYPARQGIFIHVLDDPDKVRDWYIGIEPELDHPDILTILAEVEDSLLDFTDEFDAAKTEDAL